MELFYSKFDKSQVRVLAMFQDLVVQTLKLSLKSRLDQIVSATIQRLKIYTKTCLADCA